MRHSLSFLCSAGTALCSLFYAAGAASQEPATHLETGVPVRGFVLSPSISSAIAYNDNILATDSGTEKSDIIHTIAPSIAISSNWDRHAITASTGIEQQTYFDDSGENALNVRGGVGGTLNITDNTSLSANINHAVLVEARTAELGTSATQDRVDFTDTLGVLALQHRFNRLSVLASYEYQRFNFDSGIDAAGNVVDQNLRDTKRTTYQLRGDYELNPALSVFLDNRYNETDFTASSATVNRDSDGFDSTAGVTFDITNLIVGNAGIGVFTQDFADVNQGTSTGVRGELGALWSVTPITTVGTQLLSDRRALTNENGSDSRVNSASFTLDHDITNEWLFTSQASFSKVDFETIDRTDRTINGSARLSYALTEKADIGAGYNYLSQESEGLEQDINRNFDANIVMLSINARM